MDPSPRDRGFDEALRAVADELGLPSPPPEASRALESHFGTLMAWNSRMNLTAERNPARALRRHPAESLAALPYLPRCPRRLVDLGSGTGYPALVLAACRPEMEVVLVESNARKAAFLRAASRDAGLSKVRVERARVTSAADLTRLGPFDVFSCRAVAGPASWAGRVARVIAPGGVALFFLSEEEAGGFDESASGPEGLEVERRPLPTRDGAVLLILRHPGG